MGWFNKKEGEGKPMSVSRPMSNPGSLPELPKLPELPDLPQINSPPKKESPQQLPSIPNSSFGEKFSQNTIKDAVKGSAPKRNFYSEEEEDDEDFGLNDFEVSEPEPRKMPKPLPTSKFTFPKTKEVEPVNDSFDFEDYETSAMEEEEIPQVPAPREYSQERSPIYKKEPVFIRIDKFEEALKTFDKTKKEIIEIEKVLHDIAQVREDEDKELEQWQDNIVKIKDQIDKVDKDIFSRIE